MKYFVTATGTDIGKTYICKLLCKQNNWQMAKPVASGGGEMGIVSPWCFSANLAPDMAAKAQGKTIDFNEVVKYCQQQPAQLIEGAGGIMSPIATGKLNLDLAHALNIPVLLVCASYLGSISHTLTALNALKGLKITVIVNNAQPSHITPTQTAQAIAEFSGYTPIVVEQNQQILGSQQALFL